MSADNIILIITALVTLVGAVAAAAVTIIRELKKTDAVAVADRADAAAKLDTIHVLVNSRFTDAINYIKTLSDQLAQAGIVPHAAPTTVEVPAKPLPLPPLV